MVPANPRDSELPRAVDAHAETVQRHIDVIDRIIEQDRRAREATRRGLR